MALKNLFGKDLNLEKLRRARSPFRPCQAEAAINTLREATEAAKKRKP